MYLCTLFTNGLQSHKLVWLTPKFWCFHLKSKFFTLHMCMESNNVAHKYDILALGMLPFDIKCTLCDKQLSIGNKGRKAI